MMYKITFFSFLFFFSLSSMDHSAIPFPKEVFYYGIKLQNDRQVIGRFGQTCHENQRWYRDLMICKDPHNKDCTSPLCCFMTEHEPIRMRPLAFYAKEYKRNEPNNAHARDIFLHLWRHHVKERTLAVATIIGIENPTYDDILSTYAGEYAAKEMGNLCAMKTKLSSKICSTIIDHNTNNLKKFLIDKNIWAVKTMLLANILWFDPSVRNRNSKGYDFGNKKEDTIFDCACDLNDMEIINQIVAASRIDCVVDAIESMIQNYRIELLDSFIRKHYEKAREERFFLWRCAVKNRYWDSRVSYKDSVFDLQVFHTIISLLFPQQIDAQDKYKRSLLHEAISENNLAAVCFLIEQGANINLPDYNGFFPLYNAYESPEITQLLIKNSVDVNQRNIWGRTALMSAICHATCNKNTIKVMNILLEAGADAYAFDERGQSVLHHYTERFSNCSDYAAETIKTFIKLGVKIDQEDNDGRTPLDYAQQNGNRLLMVMLKMYALDRKKLIKRGREQLMKEKKLLPEDLPFNVVLTITDKKDTQTPANSLPSINQISEKKVNPIFYKKTVTMASFLLFSLAMSYYLFKNIYFYPNCYS